jgi:UrcA family protein
MMLRFFSLVVLGTMAAAPVGAQPADRHVLVEAPAMAHRVVKVSRGDLMNPSGLSRVRRELGSAAKAACAEQYPAEGEYYFTRACVSGSLHDALAQLRTIQGQQSLDASASGSQISVVVGAK